MLATLLLFSQRFLIFTALYNFNQYIHDHHTHTHSLAPTAQLVYLLIYCELFTKSCQRDFYPTTTTTTTARVLTVAVTVRAEQQQQQLARNEKFGKFLQVLLKCIIHTVRRGTVDTLAAQ